MKFSLLVVFCFLIFGCSITGTNKELIGTNQTFACTSGDITAHSAIVWFRMNNESVISIQYSKEPDLKHHHTLPSMRAKSKKDFIVKAKINNLEAKTKYFFRAIVKGKKAGLICKFSTAPKKDDLTKVKFAFSGDTRETHQPFLIMDSIRAIQPDFFLFLGDTIYADHEGAAHSLESYWGKYKSNRYDLPSQRLFSETSLYLTWDDHEVENNYDPLKTSLLPIARQAFFDYWPIDQKDKNPDRIYRSFRWGKAAELFILDARQYRDRDAGTMLGEKQRKWFIDAITSSDALFKFVATSVPISSRRHPDKWAGFLAERHEVLSILETIPGTIFLTADVHFAAESRIKGYSESLREFIVGPLAMTPSTKDRNHYKRFDFYYNDSYNYGLVSVYPNASPPYAEIEIRDTENKILHSTQIALDE